MLPLLLLVLLGVAPAAPHRGLHARIAELDVLLDEQPDDVEAWLTRADLHRRHGDLAAARADLDHARALPHCPPRADLVEAELHADAGEHASALRLLERHLDRRPDDDHAARRRARCLAAQGRLREALAAWDALLDPAAAFHDEPAPDDYMERLELTLGVVTLTPTQRLRRGRDGLDAGLARLGLAPALQLRAVELSEQLGEVDDALARLDTLAARSPRKERWLAERGDLLARAGRLAEARAAYEASLDALADLPARHRDLAAMHALHARVEASLGALPPVDSPDHAPP